MSLSSSRPKGICYLGDDRWHHRRGISYVNEGKCVLVDVAHGKYAEKEKLISSCPLNAGDWAGRERKPRTLLGIITVIRGAQGIALSVPLLSPNRISGSLADSPHRPDVNPHDLGRFPAQWRSISIEIQSTLVTRAST